MSKSARSWAGVTLEHAGAELGVDMVIGDDGQVGLVLEGQGAAHMFANEPGIARVLGIHGDGGVGRDGLGTGGGDGQPGAGFFDDLDLEEVERALLLLHDDLFVGEGGQ